MEILSICSKVKKLDRFFNVRNFGCNFKSDLAFLTYWCGLFAVGYPVVDFIDWRPDADDPEEGQHDESVWSENGFNDPKNRISSKFHLNEQIWKAGLRFS